MPTKILAPAAIIALLVPPLCGASAIPPPAWIKMPIVSADARKAGGEGAQWPRGPVAVSPADPDFLLLPVDVGGLYRSLDGGKNWQSAMVGWDARGANGFAIDPKNANHVLGSATNSMNWDSHWGPSPLGLYLSTDKAGSWTHVLPALDAFSGGAAFDPSSYDAAQGVCTCAYYLSSTGLYRSEDGGRTWLTAHGPVGLPIGRAWNEGGTVPTMLQVGLSGGVYVAGADGLSRSDDRGTTFTKLRPEAIYGLCLTPGGLYVSGDAGIGVSKDGGRTWTSPACRGLVRPEGRAVSGLAVSPADPHRMLCWVANQGNPNYPDFTWPRYVSSDAGETWQRIRLDFRGETLKTQGRENYATWSPADPNVAWSIGGDFVVKSPDGGRTFHWSNAGYNGVMAGGAFNFDPRHPDLVFVGFQDYDGAFTTDGGRTWTAPNVSGLGWGGHEYGAYAVTKDVLYAGEGEGWYSPRHLRLSRDGGKTWAFVPGSDGKPLEMKGPDTSCGDPNNPAVCFASDLRSADGGQTWACMPACDGVYTASGVGVLYGKKKKDDKTDVVVASADGGLTWRTVSDVEGGFGDLAVGRGARLYAASQDHLKAWDGAAWTTLDTPADQYGNSRVWTVATDPADPDVVYVGGPRNTYASQATVCRSTDGGRTWRNLTVTSPLPSKTSAGAGSGPHEVSCIRVNPRTREAWVAGQCYGLWKIGPPAPGEVGLPASQASAPKAVNPPAPAAVEPPPGTGSAGRFHHCQQRKTPEREQNAPALPNGRLRPCPHFRRTGPDLDQDADQLAGGQTGGRLAGRRRLTMAAWPGRRLPGRPGLPAAAY